MPGGRSDQMWALPHAGKTPVRLILDPIRTYDHTIQQAAVTDM